MHRPDFDRIDSNTARDAHHFRAVMGLLAARDVDGADEYLLRIKFLDGLGAYEAVCQMVAMHVGVPPKSSPR